MIVLDQEKLDAVRKGRSVVYKWKFLPNGRLGLRDAADTCYVAEFNSVVEMETEMESADLDDRAAHACTQEPCPKCDEGTEPEWQRHDLRWKDRCLAAEAERDALQITLEGMRTEREELVRRLEEHELACKELREALHTVLEQR